VKLNASQFPQKKKKYGTNHLNGIVILGVHIVYLSYILYSNFYFTSSPSVHTLLLLALIANLFIPVCSRKVCVFGGK